MQSAEIFIVALGIGGLLLALILLTALLTLSRQRRAWKKQQKSTPYTPGTMTVPAPYTPQPVKPPAVKRVIPANGKHEAIPAHLRLPTQPSAPDQVVIQIDPLDGPTREQRNVQRLIAYFKNDSTQAG